MSLAVAQEQKRVVAVLRLAQQCMVAPRPEPVRCQPVLGHQYWQARLDRERASERREIAAQLRQRGDEYLARGGATWTASGMALHAEADRIDR